MYTIRCTINGSLRYYKCERIADVEALQDVLAKAGITDAIVL